MKEIAVDIATSMELNQKSVKRSFQTFKELFDIVLNSEESSPKPSSSYERETVRAPAMLFGMAPQSCGLKSFDPFAASMRSMSVNQSMPMNMDEMELACEQYD